MNRRTIIKAGSAGAVLSVLQPVLGNAAATARMPALYISHGTPLHAIWDNQYTRGWRELGPTLPRPKAILSISAHWITRGEVLVSGQAAPPVIYDVRGFPAPLYQVKYPSPGDPTLAATLVTEVSGRKILTSDAWGYDHGSWAVLTHLFPVADIPVIQLSIDYGMTPAQHFELGQQLAFLRERGVLLMGSGQFVHNLPLMGSRTEEVPPYPFAVEFGDVVGKWIEERDFVKVQRFQSLGELARLAHPTWDHFLPLLSVLGTVDAVDSLSWVNRGIMSGSMDMRCLVVS